MRESKWQVGTVDAATTFTVLTGFSAHETAGSTAVIALRDTDVVGDEVIQINLGAAGSETVSLPHLRATEGEVWFVDLQSGTVEWAVFGY